MMKTLAPTPLNLIASTSNSRQFHRQQCHFRINTGQPIKFHCQFSSSFGALCQGRANCSDVRGGREKLQLNGGTYGNWMRGENWIRSKKRFVLGRFNQGFGFNGGGGGGDGANARLLGNLALAVGLTYLSMTGQLGWVLDAIVSLWLLAVLVPIVGLGAFLWWAGRDMVQGTCPNCGNAFQIFKSSTNDELQLCPFCSQPFSVEGSEFVRDNMKSSIQSTPFGQAFSDFVPRSRKGEENSAAVVDVEAEIKDAD